MSDTISVLRSKQTDPSLELLDPDFAAQLDDQDPLSEYRNEFFIPTINPNDPSSPKTTYLCGNSLGLQPKHTHPYLEEELDCWKRLGVNGHFKAVRPWITIEDPVIPPLAKLVGAKEIEVAPMNSLTVDLHVLMLHFYRPTKERFKIIMEDVAFPSDTHAIEAQVRLHGYTPDNAVVLVKARPGEHILRTEDILSVIEREGPQLALVLFSGVQFYSGQFFDIRTITQAGHKVGAVVGWDLAHATGNLPLSLHDWEVDFACWCSYKYLNSGPGAIAGIFVHEKHSYPKEEAWAPRLAGWFGHDLNTRFHTGTPFKPMPGALGFRSSNPSVLCVTALRASLDVFEKAGIANLRAKSLLLTGYLEALIDTYLTSHSARVSVITPRDPAQRGCQLSLLVHQGENFDVKVLHKQLEDRGVICDERRPNVIRVAPVPLYPLSCKWAHWKPDGGLLIWTVVEERIDRVRYNTFEDVRKFVAILKDILESEGQQK